MIITLTRTGGFTGIPLKKTIDTSQLPAPKAKEIEDLITRTEMLSNQQPASKALPDRFSYTIAIENKTLSGSITVNEQSLTSEISKVIDLLKNI